MLCVRRMGLGVLMLVSIMAVVVTAPGASKEARAWADDGTLLGEGGSFSEPMINQLLIDDTAGILPLTPAYFDADVDQGGQDFTSGLADFAVTEVPLTAADVSAAQSNGRSFAYVPFAASAVAISAVLVCNVTPGNSAPFCPNLQLTVPQLEGLFTNRISEWNDSVNLPTISGGTGPVAPVQGVAVLARTAIDPSASNLALETLFDTDATAKPLWEKWALTTENASSAVSESWPTAGGVSGGDLELADALIPVNPETEEPSPNPATWGQGANIAPIPVDWLGAPRNLPTVAIQNAAGKFEGPTVAAESAALNDASMETNNLVTFPAEGGTDPAAYPAMVMSYLVVPTTGLSAAKASALANLIQFALGPKGQADISAFGAVPVTTAMANAGLAVAARLSAQASTTAPTSTASPAVTSGTATDPAGSVTSTTPAAASPASSSSQSVAAPSLAATGSNPLPLLVSGAIVVILAEGGRRVVRRRRLKEMVS